MNREIIDAETDAAVMPAKKKTIVIAPHHDARRECLLTAGYEYFGKILHEYFD